MEYFTIYLSDGIYLKNINKENDNPIVTDYINEALTFKSQEDVYKCLDETLLKQKLYDEGCTELSVIKTNVKFSEEEMDVIEL